MVPAHTSHIASIEIIYVQQNIYAYFGINITHIICVLVHKSSSAEFDALSRFFPLSCVAYFFGNIKNIYYIQYTILLYMHVYVYIIYSICIT